MSAALATGLALALLLLAAWAWRARRKNRELEDLVADRSARLERLQSDFERFAPPDVIENLTEPGGALAPARRAVTVMFADLRSFTSLSEGLDPAQLVDILNGYFEAVTSAIHAHHGRVTQFIGDGLLALFGALEPNPWQARDAVLAALDMRAALADYNHRLREQGLPALAFGIGIHHGEVVAGIMGNRSLSTYTVVGDTVNTAARVEQLTRTHDVDILVTDAIKAKLGGAFRLREMPATLVKGKELPVATYAVEGPTAAP